MGDQPREDAAEAMATTLACMRLQLEGMEGLYSPLVRSVNVEDVDLRALGRMSEELGRMQRRWEGSIDIGTITSGANVDVLRRIRDDDPGLTKLAVCTEQHRGRRVLGGGGSDSGFEYYCPSDHEDLRFTGTGAWWTGSFIGSNKNLRELVVYGSSFAEPNNSLLKFLAGVSRNRSIRGIRLHGIDLSNVDILRTTNLIFKNNANLRRVEVIDDNGVEALMGALANGNRLRDLELSQNPAITTRGLQSIADAVQHPTTDLRALNLLWNGVDDEGANILALAVANNQKLRILGLLATNEDPVFPRRLDNRNLITPRGWQAFADVLCNTSSVEATYRSNHTLRRFSWTKSILPNIGDEGSGGGTAILSSLAFSLEMNQRGPREEAARRKIIEHHLSSDESMGHFAGMDRAVLPRVLAWVPDDELSLLYRVVRNLHSELDSVPTSAEAQAGPHA
ncbi:hypothetical protein ACHAXT_002690 [Thalassiosira profunda]